MRTLSVAQLHGDLGGRDLRVPLVHSLLVRVCFNVYHARFQPVFYTTTLGRFDQRIFFAGAALQVKGKRIESPVCAHVAHSYAKLAAESSLYPRVHELMPLSSLNRQRLFDHMMAVLPRPDELTGLGAYWLVEDLAELFGWPMPEYTLFWRKPLVECVGSFYTSSGTTIEFGCDVNPIRVQEAVAKALYSGFYWRCSRSERGTFAHKGERVLDLHRDRLIDLLHQQIQRMPLRETLGHRLKTGRRPNTKPSVIVPPTVPTPRPPAAITDYLKALRVVAHHQLLRPIIRLNTCRVSVRNSTCGYRTYCARAEVVISGISINRHAKAASRSLAQQAAARKIYWYIWAHWQEILQAVQTVRGSV